MTATTTRPVAGRLFSRPATAASCLAFVLIGALQSLYGPVVPALRGTHGLDAASAGLALSLHFTGGVIGVLGFHAVHARIRNRHLLSVSYGLMAAGSAGFALAPGWPSALVAAFLGGLGFGGIDYGLNQLFAVGFGQRSPAMLNILNAHFGIGAVLGPAVLAALGPDRWVYAFLGCAVLSAALVGGTRGVADDASDIEKQPRAGSRARMRLSPLFLGFVALYVLNVGVEAGVGGWEPTHLETVGFSAAAAASATSVYWLMLTAGRFLVVPLALRYPPERILTVCAAGMTGCLLLALVPGAAPVAYAGAGLFIAPVFPTGLPWLHRALPTARSAGAWVIAASMVGGVAAPPLLGLGIEVWGIGAVPVLLTVLSGAGLAVTVRLARQARPGAVISG